MRTLVLSDSYWDVLAQTTVCVQAASDAELVQTRRRERAARLIQRAWRQHQFNIKPAGGTGSKKKGKSAKAGKATAAKGKGKAAIKPKKAAKA